jgi:outer membrane protein
VLAAILGAALWPTLSAQPQQSLTLEQARQIALKNHPRVRSANLIADAAQAAVTEAKAPLYPLLSGNITGTGAQLDSAVAAGALPTSSLSSRIATGIGFNQLITDFGRTSNLIGSARLKAEAQGRNSDTVKALVVLEAEQAFYSTLGAQAVLKAAQAAVENRQLTLRQVRALAEAAFNSTLDVSFAEVALSEAELVLYRTENNLQAGRARLAAALGYEIGVTFDLVDEPLPPLTPTDLNFLISQALNQRPDLAALGLNREAAARFAEAEKRLSLPSLSFLSVTGGIPQRISALPGTYGAAGININIPILNGGLYKARRTEAELRAKAASSDVEDLTVQIARDVRTAWLEMNTAYRRLDVTARLVQESDQALRLAQIRYENGLGSIVELNQAQLNQTSAQIEAASAKYEYLSRRALLDYAIGALP